MNELHNIERYFRVIDNSLFMTTGNLDYDRLTLAITSLASAINEYDGDTESMWYIGECDVCSLADLIVGAFWHYTEWHAGQWSPQYAALSQLGQIFDPGMSSVEYDNQAYLHLDDMAKYENDQYRSRPNLA